MAKKLTSVLGIDIGSQHIKVCEVKTQGKEPVITALGIAPTPEGAVDHTGVYNSDAVGTTLKQLLSQSGASSSAAVVSIAGQASVLVRTLEVPRMNPDELRDHMQWEINRNIPFAESTIVSDFKPLMDEDPNSPNMDVVMAIAPQSAIDMMIDCVKKAGKVPAAIDVEPLGMARALARSQGPDIRTVCLVDIGAKTASINIYRGSKLVMPRQVPLGGEMFTREIANALALPFEEAETRKIEEAEVPAYASEQLAFADPFAVQPGTTTTQEFQPYNPFADDPVPGYEAPVAPPVADPFAMADESADPADPATPVPAEPTYDPAPVPATTAVDQMYQAFASVLEEFVAEVRRSIDYYRSRGGDVDEIALCGGGAKLRGLAEHVEKSVGVRTMVFDPMQNVAVNAKKASPEFIQSHREEFTVAVGNGLWAFFD